MFSRAAVNILSLCRGMKANGLGHSLRRSVAEMKLLNWTWAFCKGISPNVRVGKITAQEGFKLSV